MSPEEGGNTRNYNIGYYEKTKISSLPKCQLVYV